MNEIAYIVILYKPDLKVLEHNISNSGLSHKNFILIDNTDDSDLSQGISNLFENVTYVANRKNFGIASAQNIGIQIAINKNYEFIVFFDQDSIIPNNYHRDIVEEYTRIEKQCPELFLLGPTVFNLESSEEYRSVIHKKLGYKGIEEFYYQRDVISSGSCVRASKISDVGTMDEKLFIDAVDFEWCWRAQSKGFVTGITPNVTLGHKVGQKDIKFPLGYRVIISSPFRYYYSNRNYMWLMRRNYVPIHWKINRTIKTFLRLLYFPFVLKNGLIIEKFMLKGLAAGFKKSNSKYERL